MISSALLQAIVAQYQGSVHGIHGLGHWARVYENALRLASHVDADRRVLELFAVFHDACRLNDAIDPGHGARGAELARVFRGEYFELDDEAMALLTDACERHTDGHLDGPPSVQVCWDADRLDLLRCDITPRPERLSTPAARDPELMAWANARAAEHARPEVLTATWLRWLQP